MPPQKICSDELVYTQLEKILSSAGFARNERLSGFLRFVVERELCGRGDELKESVIGVEYFGRQPDYDVRQDSVVRNEAAKLRSRLAEYYVAAGAEDGVIIDLPKGGYKPAFRQIEKAPALVPGPTASRRRVRIWLAVALAGCAIVAAALWWQGILHPKAPISIAVLPLINLDRNPDHDSFADGLSGEIIRNLSIIEGLAVRSQTSSFAFKGKAQNIRDAGKQLDAEYILEGSVLRSGQRLRINARLVRVRDDFALWTGGYGEELTDVFAIQDKISRGIVNSLRLELGRGRRRYETSIEAYDLYLRAQALPIRRGLAGYEESIVPLREAIRKDPSFAPAYAGLAVAHGYRSAQFKSDIADEVAKMRAAANQAIQLDPLLADAHAALGFACARDAQWAQSEKSFRRAIELAPSRSESHGDFGFHVLFPLGRIKEAVHHLEVAEKSSPLSGPIHYELAFALMSARRYKEAGARCQMLPIDFELKNECLGEALLGQGKIDEAIRILETSDLKEAQRRGGHWSPLGCAYTRVGRRDEAERIAASSFNPLIQAYIFACLGDKNRTFEALERASNAGPFRIGRLLHREAFAILAGDARLETLRKKVGLPE